jgi:aflatoxin B1 aldehyde reductase
LSGHAVALRWIMYHSSLSGELGDKIIIGASNLEQLKQNLEFFEQGSLSEKLLKAVNEVWEMAKDTAPVYHR